MDICYFALCGYLSLSVSGGNILILCDIQIRREWMDLWLCSWGYLVNYKKRNSGRAGE